MAAGKVRWYTAKVPTDVSGCMRFIHADSEHGRLRIAVFPSSPDAAAFAVEIMSAEQACRKLRAEYGNKY